MLLEKWLLTVQPSIGADVQSLYMFGDNTWGQLGTENAVFKSSPVLVGTKSWSQVASGLSHTIGIRSDGKLYGWGANNYGQIGNNDLTLAHRSSPIQIGTSNWASVSANGDTSYAINSDGLIFAWGLGFNGQLGNNSMLSPWAANSWTQVLAGNTIGIKSDNTMWAIGGINFPGTLGLNDGIHRSSPVQIGTDSWTSIGGSGGNAARTAIRYDNTLWVWGGLGNGQGGNNNGTNLSSPTLTGSLTSAQIQQSYVTSISTTQRSWISVSYGTQSLFGITSNGALFAWGLNTYGNLGLNDIARRSSPVQVGTSSWASVSANNSATFAIRADNTLWSWGYNVVGQLGQNDVISRSSPVQIGAGTWSKLITNAGIVTSHIAAIDSNGSLWTWGNNASGQLGLNDTNHRSSPVQLGSSSWSMISSGQQMMIGITTAGKIFAWGDNSNGQLGDSTVVAKSSPIQIGTSSWSMVTSGSFVTMGITAGGALYSWGAGTYLGEGLGIAKSSPVQITSLATGSQQQAYLTSAGKTGLSWISVSYNGSSKLAVRSDGALLAWGQNNLGQLGLNDIINRSSPVQVGTSSWTAVATGQNTLAIKSDGTLWAWGTGQNGVSGLNDTLHRSSPVQVGTDTWTDVTTGTYTAGGIKSDGTLWMWGSNTYGTLGLNDTVNRSSPVQVGTDSWTMVICEGAFPCATAIRYDGALFTWGNNDKGQLGLNDIAHRSSPVQVGTSSWSMIYTGLSSMVGISAGQLFTWGDNANGQLGSNTIAGRSSPVQVGVNTWVKTIMYGNSTGAIRNDGTLWTWGYNSGGQLGDNTVAHRSSPVQVGISSWSIVGAATAVDSNGMLYSWGNGASGTVGDNAIAHRSSPVFIRSGIYDSWTYASSGESEFGAIRSDGLLFRWGYNGFGALGGNPGNQTLPLQVTTSSWTIVPAGASGGMGITSNGQLYTWGIGTDGQIGDGNMTTMSTPVFIRSMDDFWTSTGIGSVNAGHIAGIRSDNTLWLWGLGTSGQLGQNNVVSRSQPIQLGQETLSWTYIAGSSILPSTAFSAGIKSDGSLWAWGNNTYGQLGINSILHRSSPVQVGTSSWTQVAVGNSTMIAIKSGGTLWSWGGNNVGELGDNSLNTLVRSSPVQVGTSSWTSISAIIRNNVAAIRSDGTLFTWGYNAFGQLGDNTTTNRSSPVQIGNFVWKTISSGFNYYTSAIRLDGTLWAWGQNSNGQLGQNDVVDKSSPVQVGTSTWKQITNGANYTLGIDINNRLYTWGLNSYGQLGQNDTTDRSSPVQVGTSSWTIISAGQEGISTGSYMSSAIRSDGALFTWGGNSNGGLGLNDTNHRSSPVQVGTSSWTLVSGRMGVIQDSNKGTGYLYAWGGNNQGELGLNDVASRSSPVQVAATINTWYRVAQGDAFTVAIRNDKTLWTWGDNSQGQLGDNTAAAALKSSPVQVSGGGSWSMVSAGTQHALAINNAGVLYGWGLNVDGQLGTGTATGTIAYPVIISSLITLADEIAWSTSTGNPRTYSWTTVSGGSTNSYAIRSDGALFGWGINTNGQLGLNDIAHRSSPVQIGTSSWSSVAAGISHTYAIRSDGLLFSWGGNATGQLGLNDLVHRSSPVQIGTSSWTAVTAYGAFAAANTFAIASDGKLFGWGSNTNGSLGINDQAHRSSPVQVGTGNSWTLVTANANTTLAIRNDSKLFGWGLNTSGELGLNDAVTRSSPVQVGTGNWNKVATQLNLATIGIASDNTLYTWGAGAGGQLGDRTTANRSSPVQITSLGTEAQQQTYLTTNSKTGYTWTQVVNTNNTMFAIRNDGALFAWGDNTNGVLGLNDIVHRSSPVKVGTSSWISVSTNSSATSAIRSDNTLWVWGNNANGGLASNDLVHRSSPVQVGASSWTSVATGPTGSTIAVRLDGTLWAWGGNSNGQLGLGDAVNRSSPVQVGTVNTWSKVFQGTGNAAAAIRSDGSLYTWGRNESGSLGINDQVHRSSPVQVGTSSWTQIAFGTFYTLGIRSDGTLFTWGSGSYTGLNITGVLGTPDSTQHRSSPVQIGTSSWSAITAGGNISAGISGNLLYMWGQGLNAQFGNNSLVNIYYSPTLTTGTGSWTTIAAGSAVAAVNSAGQLYTWGTLNVAANNGVIGDGTINGRSSPVFIRSVADSWNNIGTLISGFSGIRSDGLLFTWGANTYGATGDNSTVSKSFPTQLGTTSWTMVTGYGNILGITAADTGKALFAWGLGTSGELGILSLTSRSSPVFIRAMNDSWIGVGAGQNMSSAIRSDGKLFAWGTNTAYGQLGDSSIISKSYPTQIGNNSNWAVINAGGSGTVNAITTDGNVYIWGNNTNGQLGLAFNPTTISGSWLEHRSSPVQLGALPYSNSPTQIGASSWSQVSAGVSHVLALTSTNQLFAWGNNSAYQVDNSGLNRSSPVQVGTSSWTQVSAGNVHSLAIASDNSLYGWGLQYQPWTYNPSSTLTNYVLPSSSTTSWTSLTSINLRYTGIRSDGSLWAWGYNIGGELGTNDTVHRSSPVQIGTSSWSMVNSVLSWTTAIRSDGTLWAWGQNTNGDLGQSDTVHRSSPTQIGTGNSWTKVGGVGAIRSDGALFTWGYNNIGQLGDLTVVSRSSPVQLGTSSWTSLNSASVSSLAAIRSDGLLFVWGLNNAGQLGDGTVASKSSPVQIASIYSLTQQNSYLTGISGTTYSWSVVSTNGLNGTTAAIRNDGMLFTWGDNTAGALGNNSIIHRSSPVQVGTSSWTQVSVGNLNTFAIRSDGALFIWGSNTYGQLGLLDLVHRSSPVQIGTSSWSMISAGQSSVAAIRSDGLLFTWGFNSNGELALGDTVHRSSPVQVTSNVGNSSWSMVSTNNGSTAGIKLDGTLMTAGLGTIGQLGSAAVTSRSFITAVGTSSWTMVSVGFSSMVAIRTDGTLWAWGSGSSGQTGLNDTVHRSSPVQVGTSSWTSVAARLDGAAAIRSDGLLFAWGTNNGTVGDNTLITRSSPVQIGTNTWYKIGGQYQAMAAIDNTTKQLFVWGVNTSGAIGNNSVTQANSPVFLRTANESWTQVSMNTLSAAAIRNDNLLFVWGNDTTSQLGLLTTGVHRSSPTQLGTSSWSQIAVGISHMAGLTSNKLLYTWGDNSSGQLGLNDAVNRSSPSLVSTSSWTLLSAGNTTTYGTLDGSILLYAWGNGTNGQLGDNTILNKSSPVQIASYISSPKKIGVDTWSKISAGYSHSVGINTSNMLYGWGNPAAGTFAAYSWTTLSSTNPFSAGVRSDGALFTWGDNAGGQLGQNDLVHRSSPVQVGTSSWTTVSVGGNTTEYYTLAIRSDNLLYGWGVNASGQLGQVVNTVSKSSPVQISSFSTEAIQQTYLTNTGKTGYSWTSISTGGNLTTSAAIRSDGRLFTWGYNLYGQLGQNTIISTSSPVSVGTSSWTSVTVGNNSLYAIRSDNMLFAWGSNAEGQLGQNDLVHRSSPVQVGTSSWSMVTSNSITGVTSGYVLAVRSDKALFAWGLNASGQLGLNDVVSRSSPVQIGTSSWSMVSAGSSTVTAIRSDYSLWAWGAGTNGALGDNTVVSKSSPVQISASSVTDSWIFVSSGQQFNFAIKWSGGAGLPWGALWAWGFNTTGNLGLNDILNRSSPVQVGTDVFWTKAVAGLASFGLDATNRLFSWGDGRNGQLGSNTTNIHRSSPVQIGTNSWTAISSGNTTAMALSGPNNQLYTWGDNVNGAIGTGDTTSKSSPVFIRSTIDSWNAIGAAGYGTSIGIRSDNTLWAWGLNATGQIGDNTVISKSAPVQIGASSWSQVSAGSSFSAALTADNRLFMWGANGNGQLGLGDILHRSSPVQVGTSWNIVKTGSFSSMAINSVGLLFAWGNGTNGELGNRTVVSRSSPIQVNSFTSADIQKTYLTNTSKPATYSWSVVNGGISTTAAIRSDGLLFVWGLNTSGELGLNDLVSRSSPVQLGTSSWTQIGLNRFWSAAIRIDGALFVWGNNTNGQLGLNDLVHRSSPVQVGTRSWSMISTNNNNSMIALDTTNNIWSWGFNTQGQLGLNDTAHRSSPVQVGSSTWLSINTHGVAGAIRSDSALFTWGNNNNGQLGLNDQVHRSSPVQVGTSSWTMVSFGDTMASAITTDGKLFTWGINSSGQLGLNDVASRSSPVQVGTYSWISINASSSSNFMAGIRSDNLLFEWGINTSGQLGDTSVVSRSSPVQIGTSSWSMVSAGGSATVALDGLYGLYTWGNNPDGQLGLGTITTASSPVFLPTTTDSWTSIASSNGQNYGIRSDGYLFAWGANGSGQLGLNDALPRSAPVQIGSITVPNVFSGPQADRAFTNFNNKLFVWGNNASGQLGLNDRINRSSPVQLGTNQSYTPPNLYSVPTQIGTSSWTQVSANYNSTLLIDPNNVLYEWGFNDNRPLKPAITAVGVSALTVTNGYNHFGSTK